MNRRQKIRSRQSTKPAIDLKEYTPCSRVSIFSEAYLPACNANASLVNLPMIKAGMRKTGFTFAMPPARNKGVVGRGSKE